MRGLPYYVGATGRALLEITGTENRQVGTEIEKCGNLSPGRVVMDL
jgi:hypothetical protein